MGAPIALGIVGGAVGLFAGGFAGYGIETALGCESTFLCGAVGAGLGGIAGETVGLSLGVHLGNGRRGGYLPILLRAAVSSAAGLLVGVVTEQPAVLLAIPAAQLAMTVPLLPGGAAK